MAVVLVVASQPIFHYNGGEREKINEPRQLVRSSMGAQPFACLEALKLINCVARCLIAVVEY
jgi:hypothetical protein